jgi:hypothetical protein
MSMGYVLAAFITAVVLFPVVWPVWWFLASRFETASGERPGRPRAQVS